MARRKNKQNKNQGKNVGGKKPPSNQIVKSVPMKRQAPQSNKGTGLLSALGGLAGGYFGGPLGAVLGKGAGDLIAKITGFGDYKVNSNTLVTGNSVPTFRQFGDGIEICHREFIGDITGSTVFANNSITINPGLSSSFPWLSQVAQNFEEYDMKGLVFEYRPSSGSAVSATSAALGVVIYATDYNVLSPVFSSKQVMESYEFSCSTVPFTGMLHPVECAKNANALNTLYIRNTGVPAGADARLYDMGLFQYATQGMQSAYVTGELWVAYHVMLKKPRISTLGLPQTAHIVASPAGSATAAKPLGTTGGVLSSLSNLPGVTVSISAPTTSIVIANPGQYIVACGWNGSTITTSFTFASIGSNITNSSNIFLNNTQNDIISSQTAAASGWVLISVNAFGTGAANTIAIGGPATMTAANGDILVMPVPLNLN
jgi:hypothetical protein